MTTKETIDNVNIRGLKRELYIHFRMEAIKEGKTIAEKLNEIMAESKERAQQ